MSWLISDVHPNIPLKWAKLLKVDIDIIGGCLVLAAVACAEYEEEMSFEMLCHQIELVSPSSKSEAFCIQMMYSLLSFLFALKTRDIHYDSE